MIPSPHTSPQTEGSPLHDQPDSSWQLASQPSPGAVPPSSQVSPGSITSFPQTTGAQVEGKPVQAQSFSIVQVCEQPSPASRLPSSQVSVAASWTPLPQLSLVKCQFQSVLK